MPVVENVENVNRRNMLTDVTEESPQKPTEEEYKTHNEAFRSWYIRERHSVSQQMSNLSSPRHVRSGTAHGNYETLPVKQLMKNDKPYRHTFRDRDASKDVSPERFDSGRYTTSQERIERAETHGEGLLSNGERFRAKERFDARPVDKRKALRGNFESKHHN